MRLAILALLPLVWSGAAAAQTVDHAAHGHAASPPEATAPAAGPSTPPAPATDHAADRIFDPAAMARAREVLRAEHGGMTMSNLTIDILEYQGGSDDAYSWEVEAWTGGDVNRFVVKTEGEGTARHGLESAEIQALYSRAATRYTDLQVGLRRDLGPGPELTYAVAGFETLLPYWVEAEGAVFLSEQGDLLARIEGSYDLRLTQRLILQPSAELSFAVQDVPEIEVGSGLSKAELGLRLRYEIRREFGPYVGVSYERSFGKTADFARHEGEDVEETRLVVGVRAWF
jgi:copper resistance protein B